MVGQTFDGHLDRAVEVDVCDACQAFWFDQRESLQLTPAATLQLFRVIGEQTASRRQSVAPVTKCPRCASQLLLTHDMQRNVGFQYRRCPHGHGRLITFYDFLREKNFIRPVSPAQLEDLRRSVQSVNCSNCGAPVDLAKASACTHCGTPLSMIDLKQAGALISQLQEADAANRTVDPALSIRLEQARREVDTAFARTERGQNWFESTSSTDLVATGLSMLARWVKR
jgi:hypothetical protein